jgi:hypothetical protein
MALLQKETLDPRMDEAHQLQMITIGHEMIQMNRFLDIEVWL